MHLRYNSTKIPRACKKRQLPSSEAAAAHSPGQGCYPAPGNYVYNTRSLSASSFSSRRSFREKTLFFANVGLIGTVLPPRILFFKGKTP